MEEVPPLKIIQSLPRLVWLSWLGVIAQRERSPVQFPVGAHAWVVDLVPSRGAYRKQPMDVSPAHACFSPSLSPSLSLSLKTNKIFKKKFKKTGILCLLFSLKRVMRFKKKKRFYLFFKEKGRERERGGETWICKRNISWLPLACPQLGSRPTTHARALAGNQTSHPSVHRPVLRSIH